MQEVSGSIPLTSTKYWSLSSRGLGHNPFTVGTGVRIPLGTPIQSPLDFQWAFIFAIERRGGGAVRFFDAKKNRGRNRGWARLYLINGRDACHVRL